MLMLEEVQAVSEVGGGGRGRGAKSRAPGQVAEAGVRLPLAGIVVEVRHQADAQGVGAVQAFDNAEVSGRLCEALSEAQTAVVHRQGMGVKVTFASSCMEHLQVVHSHLQNLSFLQFSRTLFLECAGDKSAQLT